jgi:hypothetical protein
MFFFQEGFTYRNFLMDVLGIFFFVVWFWLLIIVFADLFRRHDISGWIKAIWVMSRYHVESNFKLGAWVSTQRIRETETAFERSRICLALARLSLGSRLYSPYEVQAT